MAKLDPDDYAEWRENPITIAVMRVLEVKSVEAKASWIAQSWGAGVVDPLMLADLRASAGAWQYVISLDVEEIEGVLDGSGED